MHVASSGSRGNSVSNQRTSPPVCGHRLAQACDLSPPSPNCLWVLKRPRASPRLDRLALSRRDLTAASLRRSPVSCEGWSECSPPRSANASLWEVQSGQEMCGNCNITLLNRNDRHEASASARVPLSDATDLLIPLGFTIFFSLGFSAFSPAALAVRERPRMSLISMFYGSRSRANHPHDSTRAGGPWAPGLLPARVRSPRATVRAACPGGDGDAEGRKPTSSFYLSEWGSVLPGRRPWWMARELDLGSWRLRWFALLTIRAMGGREGITFSRATLQSDARKFPSRHNGLAHCTPRSRFRHVYCVFRTRRLSPVSVLIAGANSQLSTPAPSFVSLTTLRSASPQCSIVDTK